MGDGSGDLQRVWHEFVGEKLLAELSPNEPLTVLDVGAGRGLSKERLAQDRHKVTTQDINRAHMLDVDLIMPIEEVPYWWDVMTAFDVVEHVWNPGLFVEQLLARAKRHVFITTPNHALYPHPWHFTVAQFFDLMEDRARKADLRGAQTSSRYFCRYKEGERDEIREVSLVDFMRDSPRAYALGIGVSFAG